MRNTSLNDCNRLCANTAFDLPPIPGAFQINERPAGSWGEGRRRQQRQQRLQQQQQQQQQQQRLYSSSPTLNTYSTPIIAHVPLERLSSSSGGGASYDRNFNCSSIGRGYANAAVEVHRPQCDQPGAQPSTGHRLSRFIQRLQHRPNDSYNSEDFSDPDSPNLVLGIREDLLISNSNPVPLPSLATTTTTTTRRSSSSLTEDMAAVRRRSVKQVMSVFPDVNEGRVKSMVFEGLSVRRILSIFAEETAEQAAEDLQKSLSYLDLEEERSVHMVMTAFPEAELGCVKAMLKQLPAEQVMQYLNEHLSASNQIYYNYRG